MDSGIDSLLNELASERRVVAICKGNKHPLYLLAVYVHGQRQSMEVKEVKRLLTDRGCPVDRAGFYCRQVETFCELLRVYDGVRNQVALT